MVRLSKPARRRSVSYKRPSKPGKRGQSVTSPVRIHANALTGDAASSSFIPKIS